MRAMARRYILVKIVCDRRVTNEEFHEALNNSTKRYFGELGLSRIDPRIVKFDAESSTAIVSCEQPATSELESAMALTTRYAETPMSLLVLRVSGTVKGAARRRK
jgi:RNase P/RNase MRP subunit POP5